MRKILAFTLAETLIVMGIIGIVSALTLPNLNASTGEKEKVAKVKKLYSNLNDAVGRATAIYGPLSEWTKNDTTEAAQVTRFGERLTEFMKVSKNCGVNANQGCISKTTPKTTSGTGGTNLSTNDTSTTNYKVILADGSSFQIVYYNTGHFSVVFDIDGPNKGSNTIGKDVFCFDLDTNNSEVAIPSPSVLLAFLLTTGRGEEAANWVINYDNMDYLKADSTGKCSNSNVTLNALANPPVVSCK